MDIFSNQNASNKLPFHHFLVSLLLWKNYLPSSFDLLLKILAELQIIGTLITDAYDHFSQDESNSITTVTSDIGNYASFRFNYNTTWSTTFIFAVFGIISAYLFIVLCLTIAILIAYSQKFYQESRLTKIWNSMGIIHYNLIFLIIQQFIISIIKDVTTDEDSSLGSNVSNKTVILCIGIILIVINSLYALFISKFAYFPVKDSHITATRTSNFQFIGVFFKLVDTLFNTFLVENDAKPWIMLATTFIFFGIRLNRYLKEYPFYHYRALQIFFTMILIQNLQLVLIVIWVLIDLKRNISFVMVIGSHFIFTLFAMQFAWSHIRNNFWKFASRSNKQLKSVNEFYKKSSALDTLLRKGGIRHLIPDKTRASEYEILFMQLISSHGETCQEMSCSCRILLQDKTFSLEKSDEKHSHKFDGEKLYFTCICELYNDGIKHLNTNVLLKLQLSHFLIENDETAFLTAINLATSVKSESQNLEFRLTKLELLRQIEMRIKGSFLLQNSTLNVKQLIDYYMIKQQLRYSIVLNTKMFEEFWETYKSPHPHMIKLTRLSRAINRDADKVKALWENLAENYASFCYKDYIVFALYTRLIRSAPFTSEKLITKYFAVNSLRLTTHAHGIRHGGSFFVEDNIFICFSLDQGSFAHISFVSQNVEDIGYQMKDLKGKSIGLLMPPVFAKKHHNYITNQILSGHTNLMAKDLHIFLRCSNGFLQPATAYLMPFPYLEKGFNCLAIIKLTKNFNENYIVMLPDGKIDANSEKLATQLGLNSKNMDSCYIDDVCPEAYKIFNYINNIPALEAKGTNGKGSPNNFNSRGASMGSEQDLWRETQSSHILAGSSFKQKKSLHAVLLQKRLQNQVAAEAERNQDIIEDFEHRGARLKFMTYTQTTKAIQKNDKPNFSLDVTVSKIKYAGEDVYILKTVKVKEEVTVKEAVVSQEIINGTVSNADGSGEVISSEAEEDELEDISRSLKKKLSNLVPVSKIKHRRDPKQMADTAGKRYKSTSFGSTRLEEKPKVVLVERRNPRKGKVGKEHQGEVNIKENVKQDIKDYIKQNILKEVDPFLEAGNGDTSSTRSVTKGLLTLAKLEKAIYYREGVTSYKLVKSAVVGFILMAIALFIYYLVQGNTNFDNLKDNVTILELTITRLFNVVETNRRATIVNLLESGFIPKERDGYTDFSVALIGDYLFVSGNLSQDNNELRESVYKFNKKQQAEFYQMLPVYQVDDTSTITQENSFDLCSQLVSAGYRLYSALPDTPTPDNPDLNFIRNNTMNGLVIHSENLFSLLQAEDTTIIQGMKNMQLALLMILVGAGIMAILVLIKSEFTFIRKKMLFFDFFLRIDDNEVDTVLAKTNAFLELLKDNNNSEEDIMNLMQDAENAQHNPVSAKRDVKKQVKTLKRQNKKGDFSKINKDSWIGVLSLGIFVACFWAVYGFLYIFFVQKEASTTSIKWQIIQTDTLLARLSEGITILYMYIGGNEPSDVTIRGYPLSVEFENNYDIIMSSNEFFAGLEQKDFGSYTDQVRALLTGDLCPIVDSEDGFSCYADGEGSKLHGMVGIINYYLQMVNLLKTAYDDSNKTIEAKQDIYSRDDYGEFERVYLTTLIPSYQQFEEVSREIFLATLDQFQQEILTINIVSLIFFLLLGRYYWTTGLKSMQMEKIYFREMMRVIPVMVILQNKFLHTYLMNNSKKLFNKNH